MLTPTLEQVVSQAGDISAIPTVARRALEQLDAPEGSPIEVGETLAHDPVLAARILKVANSALFGAPRGITSLHQAVTLMGFRTTRDLVLLASLRAAYRRFGLPERLLWSHSIACGIGARHLARAFAPECLDDAFICGLLHDVGKVVLLNEAPDAYAAVMKRADAAKEASVTAERAILGYTHAELGATVAEQWHYPAIIRDVVRLHHAEDERLAASGDEHVVRVVALVDLANTACKVLGTGYMSARADLRLEARPGWALIGLDGRGSDALVDEIRQAFTTQAAGWA